VESLRQTEALMRLLPDYPDRGRSTGDDDGRRVLAERFRFVGEDKVELGDKSASSFDGVRAEMPVED